MTVSCPAINVEGIVLVTVIAPSLNKPKKKRDNELITMNRYFIMALN